MIATILRWLPLSLALHLAAVAAALMLPRESALSPLFVDLTLVEPATTAGGSARAPEPGAADAHQRPAPAARRVTAPPAARAVPSSPARAAPAPSVAQPEPPPPPPTAAIEPVPAPPTVEPRAEPPIAPAPSAAPSASSQNGSAPPTAPEPGASGSTSSTPTASGGGGEAATGPAGLGPDIGGFSAAIGARGGGEAVALGISGDDAGVYAGYIAMLRRRVQEALTYPSAARRRGLSGTVHLDISVEPTGRIADVLVVRSSSHDLLDAAALDAVRVLRQVPFPAGVRPRAVRVRLPVVFELR